LPLHAKAGAMPRMRLKSLLRKLGVSLLSLFVLAGVAELVARAAEPGPMTLRDVTPYERKLPYAYVHKRSWKSAWDGTYYEINARGWRGPEYEPKFTDDEFRVVAIGDSTTFGKSVDEHECWPRQFEALLARELGPAHKPMVGNLGVNGYASNDYVDALVGEGLEVKPQLVVVAYCLNDFPNVLQKIDAKVFQNDGNLRAKIPNGLRDQLGHFALFRFARATYYEWNRARDLETAERLASEIGEGGGAPTDRILAERERLKKIVDESTAIGAHVIVFLIPYESMVYLDGYAPGPNTTLREMAEPLGAAFIDMPERFRAAARETAPMRKLFVRGDRYHPDPQGYALVAAAVYETARARGWLPATN
jgi:lysophospholipase L1-like esterase